MANKTLHQILTSALVGDATSEQVFTIRRWLREMGFSSEIYSINTHKELEKEVRQFSAAALAGEECLVFHHSIGSPALDQVREQRIPLILIYHNITPPEFFAGTDPVLAKHLKQGREQLAMIRPLTRLALAASPYSEKELKERISRLGAELKKTGKETRDKITSELIPMLEEEIAELRRELETMGREEEVEPVEEALENIRYI